MRYTTSSDKDRSHCRLRVTRNILTNSRNKDRTLGRRKMFPAYTYEDLYYWCVCMVGISLANTNMLEHCLFSPFIYYDIQSTSSPPYKPFSPECRIHMQGDTHLLSHQHSRPHHHLSTAHYQHVYREHGYTCVQTKTPAVWRSIIRVHRCIEHAC
jgi:hypothetical protein